MPKFTPWFPHGTKPVRKGVYNTKSAWCSWDAEGAYQYWNGTQWKCTDATAAGAYRDRMYRSDYQEVEWRGLAEPPK